MSETLEIELEAADHEFTIRVYPAAEPNGSMLVWLHGGAFMFGDIDMPEADQVGRRLSAEGCTVVSVDYTLAPMDAVEALGPPPADLDMPTPAELAAAAGDRRRARFPVASRQVVAAFDWAVANAESLGGEPTRIALGGASAGGNLSAGAALRLRDRGTAKPSVVTLVYPVLHAPLPAPDAELEALLEGLPRALTFPPESTAAINSNYLGDDPDGDGYAFPGGHDLRGYPSTVIVNADRDRLRASGQAFAAELAIAGVDVMLHREDGALHGYLNEVGHPAAEHTLALLTQVIGQARG